MKSVILALVGAFAFAPVALAALPPAPTISVAATDIKQLQFDISPVIRANWYELWFKANSGAPWVLYARAGVQNQRIRINTSVHLLDWRQARYFVKACNPGGCSQSNEVGVDGEQLAAMGYFKPATSGSNQYMGFNLAVSADGKTLVALAGERIDGVWGKAAIHVFRKTSPTSAWRLDARLFPTPNHEGGGYSVAGEPVAISSDGNTIAFANWVENNTTGAAYLFRRGSDGWHQTQRIVGGTANDQFGVYVKLDPAGKTLVIGHNRSGGVKRDGTLEVYQDPDDGSDQFVHATTVPTPVFDNPEWGYCRGVALSAVGHIVRSCYSGDNLIFYAQVLTANAGAPLQYAETARLALGQDGAVALDSLGERLVIQDYTQSDGGVTIYRRDASGWVKDRGLAPFGGASSSVAISGDGKIVAIGLSEDKLVGRGPLFAPYVGDGPESGSVAVYERRASGWALRRYVKADSTNALHSFGWTVALDQSGHVLAVGSPYDPSAAKGIDGDREDASVRDRGAVWLY
jgi:hypothetical protein